MVIQTFLNFENSSFVVHFKLDQTGDFFKLQILMQLITIVRFNAFYQIYHMHACVFENEENVLEISHNINSYIYHSLL